MKIRSASVVFFSPTDTTKKIVYSVIKGMNAGKIEEINLNSCDERKRRDAHIKNDIAVIGVPVYGGRIPKFLYPFLMSMRSDRKPAVLIVVYGNVHSGFALNELYNILKDNFTIVAAGKFIGEHSFSTDTVRTAFGRPDSMDLSEAEKFGKLTAEKLDHVSEVKDAEIKLSSKTRIAISNIINAAHNILPQNSGSIVTKLPEIDDAICIRCGVCARECPMGAIDKKSLGIDKKLCIRCFRCAKRCPVKARKIEYREKFIVSSFLKKVGKTDKKIEYFL